MNPIKAREHLLSLNNKKCIKGSPSLGIIAGNLILRSLVTALPARNAALAYGVADELSQLLAKLPK